MASLTIRQLDDEIKAKLRIRAAENGRSMEAEVRFILSAVLLNKPASSSQDIASSIQQIVKQQGAVDLPIMSRKAQPSQRHLDFSDEKYG